MEDRRWFQRVLETGGPCGLVEGLSSGAFHNPFRSGNIDTL